MNLALIGSIIAAAGYALISVNAMVNGNAALGVAMAFFALGAFVVGFL